MVNCPKCGGLNQEGSQVCGVCGESILNTNINNQNNVNINQQN